MRWISFHIELPSSVRETLPSNVRKNSVIFPPREGTRAGTTGRLDIAKQDEYSFFFNAQPMLWAMKNGAKQWSRFPTLSFWWLPPNAMLWWGSSCCWDFFCRITRAPFTFSKIRVPMFTLPWDSSDQKRMPIILTSALFIYLQPMFTHISDCVFYKTS